AGPGVQVPRAPQYPSRGTAHGGPERLELRDDVFAEDVAGPGERECDVRVQAFEASGPGTGATYADVELGPEPPLLLVGAREACPKLRVVGRNARPPLDTAASLEPGDLRNKVRTGEPVRRRERLAAIVVRRLLGDGRPAGPAAAGH